MFTDTNEGKRALDILLHDRTNTRAVLAARALNATYDLAMERSERINAQHEVQRLEAETIQLRAAMNTVAPKAKALMDRARVLSIETGIGHRIFEGKLQRYVGPREWADV